MDKNTIIGFVMILAIVLGFAQLNKKSDKEIATEKRFNDSIALVEQNRVESQSTAKTANPTTASDSIAANDTSKLADSFGGFSASAKGQEKFYTLENDLVKLTLSSKGGRVYSAQLKKYQTHDSLPLILFDGKESAMDFTFVTIDRKSVV